MSKLINRRGAAAPLLGSKLELKIEKLAIGGAGIARHDGLVVFVDGAAPDETVLAEISSRKKNYLEAKILEVVKPSPSRREPPCVWAKTCGGCNWQHLTEDEQLRQKESLVFETIKKFNRTIEFKYHPIQKSPRSLRYRNRIQPKFQDQRLGFYERRSHKIVEVDDCLICEDSLALGFKSLKEWAQKQSFKGLQRLELYLEENGTVRFSKINGDDDGVGFSQVNRFQNQDLVDTAISWANKLSYNHIFDLYSGSGNFTFPLAEKFPETPITAVELSSTLVARGRSKNQSSRIEFIQADVEAFLNVAQIKKTDLLLLDPPRAGTNEAIMRAIAKAGPQKIIYISCHPVSLARDIAWLMKWGKEFSRPYHLHQVKAFEMFPQTDHVETIAELRVDSSSANDTF